MTSLKIGINKAMLTCRGFISRSGIFGLLIAGTAMFDATGSWAQSGVKKIEGSVIVFDDNEKHDFTVLPRGKFVRSGSKVTLVVKNINTFREKYILKGKTEDRHNASLPDSLKTLISKTGPAFGGDVPTQGTIEKPKTSVDVETEFKALVASANALEKAVGSHSKTHDPSLIIGAIRYGKTNEIIRSESLKLVKAIVPEAKIKNHDGSKIDCWGVVDKLVERNDCDNVQDDLLAFSKYSEEINEIAKKIESDYLGNLTKLHLDLAEKNDALRKKLIPESEPDKTFLEKVVNPLVTRVNSKFEAIVKASPNSIVFFRDVFLLMMDPRAVPTRIVKSLDTDKDYVTGIVQIDQSPTALLLPTDTATAAQVKPLATGDVAYSSVTYTSPKIATFGRLVSDFSIGAVRTTLKQRNFYIAPNPDPNVKLGFVKEGPADKDNFGIGALSQFYLTSKLPLGLTAGPCLGFAGDPNRYLLGGSVVAHLSDRVRLSYSYGAAYGRRNELNGDTLNGDLLSPKVTALGTSASTANVYRWGHFQALSFTFSF